MRSGLYDMTVTHHRPHPHKHTLRMRVTMLLLDLDEMKLLERSLRWFSVDRRNIVSFRARDHGDRGGTTLRDWVAAQLAEAGIAPPGGAIRLLCMPRLLGRAFNPLSVWFCHAPDGSLAAMLYEVRNTFGQRHNYAVAVDEDTPHLRHAAVKLFYVSPFLPMEMTYRFDVWRTPQADLRVAITGKSASRVLIHAAMAGHRREITDRALLHAALRLPLQGARVLARIHWEAVKLWWKGAAFHSRPAPPARSVSRGA